VIVYLKDLSHSFFDLGPDADKIHDLESSSLFGKYLCYAINQKVEMKEKGRILWRYTKNFHVLDLKTQ